MKLKIFMVIFSVALAGKLSAQGNMVQTVMTVEVSVLAAVDFNVDASAFAIDNTFIATVHKPLRIFDTTGMHELLVTGNLPEGNVNEAQKPGNYTGTSTTVYSKPGEPGNDHLPVVTFEYL